MHGVIDLEAVVGSAAEHQLQYLAVAHGESTSLLISNTTTKRDEKPSARSCRYFAGRERHGHRNTVRVIKGDVRERDALRPTGGCMACFVLGFLGARLGSPFFRCGQSVPLPDARWWATVCGARRMPSAAFSKVTGSSSRPRSSLPGSVGAPGRIEGTGMPQILPEALILPVLPVSGRIRAHSGTVSHAGRPFRRAPAPRLSAPVDPLPPISAEDFSVAEDLGDYSRA